MFYVVFIEYNIYETKRLLILSKILYIGCTVHTGLAGSPGRAKSKFKYADPLKIFVLIYKKILINKIFHFEASYYLSQHGSHLHLTAPYSYLTDSNFWTCRSNRRM